MINNLNHTLGKSIILLLGFVYSFTYIHGQEQYFQFDHFTTDDGLSQNSVICIFQDHVGFMWFGTYNGLNRYDGTHFRVFKNNPDDSLTISDNYTMAIMEDAKNRLWIGTHGGGLNMYNAHMEEFVNIKYPDSLAGNKRLQRIYAICEGDSCDLWIGTYEGLIQYNHDQKVFNFHHYSNDQAKTHISLTINDITKQHDSILWLATNQGLLNFNLKSGKYQKYPLSGQVNNMQFDYRCMSFYNDNELWLGSWGNGILAFNTRNKTFSRVSYDHKLINVKVRNIFTDKSGNIWIGTNGSGLYRYDKNKNKFISLNKNHYHPEGLSSNNITHIYEDNSGVIWIGTDFNGVNKTYPNSVYFHHQSLIYLSEGNITSSSVMSVYEDPLYPDSILWLGTYGEGLVKYSIKNHKIINHYRHESNNKQSLSNNIVRCILRDHLHKLWIGTDGGLNLFDKKNNSFIRFTHDPNDNKSLGYNNIYDIIEDHNGHLWIVNFYGGLNRLNRDDYSFIKYLPEEGNKHAINDNAIWCLYEDNEGIIWIGTEGGGVNKFNPDTKTFEHYVYRKNQNSVSNNKVLCIHKHTNGTMWLGTNSGLNQFNPLTEKFKVFTEKDGLSSNSIQSIIEDDNGHLWLGTIEGLSFYNPKTGEFSNYDKSDGIQGKEFNVNSCFKSEKGRLYFGGVNGFNAFYPDSIRENKVIPNTVITNLLINNKQVPIGKFNDERTILTKSINYTESIKLNSKDKLVTFEFSALDFVSPINNEYEYIMEGFDDINKHWHKIGNRNFATYTNLPAGVYTFRVIGTNNDGLKDTVGASLKIELTPPFWRSKWFQAIMLVVFATSFILIYRLRIKRINKQKKDLEDIINTRTNDLIQANKKLEERQKKIELQSRELKQQKESLEETNILLEERQEEIEHQSMKLQLQTNSLNESNQLLIKRERQIRRQAERLEEQAEDLQEINKKLLERQEENEHQNLKLKVQSDALKESNELLEKRQLQIRSQANKLEEQTEVLQSAKQELEKLNATKDRFFSIIAHDLRNPINAILGFSELLSTNYENIEDSKKLELNKIIYSATKNVYNLLENLLQWSRSQTSRIKFEPMKFELTGVINENLILSKAGIKKKNLNIIKEFSTENIVHADKNMTSAILRNLITNSIKFTKPFGEIAIKTRKKDDFVEITVKDTGVGMTEDVVKNLFRIDKAHSTYGTSGEMGTGLGLIICKEFVEKHGGQISVTSEVNKGTVFSFTLPSDDN